MGSKDLSSDYYLTSYPEALADSILFLEEKATTTMRINFSEF
jgi:hypothetical protein